MTLANACKVFTLIYRLSCKYTHTHKCMYKSTIITLTLDRVIMMGGQCVVGLPTKKPGDVEGNITLWVCGKGGGVRGAG